MNYEDKRKLIAEDWNNFVVLGKNKTQEINEEVKESWKRSKINKINYEQIDIEKGDYECQKRSREKNSIFIDVSRPYMQDLYKVINNSDFMITLLDKEGFLLDVVLNTTLAEDTEFKHINLSEKRIGTNAMGTCLYLDKPIQTYAEEHFYKLLHKFTTAAAPIHNNSGALIGCIGITGFAKDVSVHTLGMAIAASYAIENKLKLYEDKNSLLLKNYTNIIHNSISDGIIVIDSNGKITSVNVVAKNMLEANQADLLNMDIQDVLIGSIDFKRFINQSLDFFNKQGVFKIGNKPIHCNISLTKLENELEVMGFIIMLSKSNGIIVQENKGNKNKLYSFEDIIGESDSIKETINIAKIASQGNSNILIMGESGTGKELFAQSIHNNSLRRNKAFIDINCGALPLSLAESELFGYEGGSYTGARKEGQPGKFELADGGTIFLDEIGELPLSIQAALLRVIQERKVTRIGATTSRNIDVMIIAATNRDLFKAVEEKTFRGDLFYRLNVFNINIPSLRENKEDISRLINHFIKKYNKLFNLNVEEIEEDALYILKKYDWPGNIRQLENIIERAVQLATNDKIGLRDLPSYLIMNIDYNKMDLNKSINILESKECKEIINILKKTRGNVKQASELLGIGRATVYRKIEKYNVNIDEFRV